MLAMRLCGNGDCAIPIGPTHLLAFIMWGRVILCAVVVVLVVVWLAAIWLMLMDPRALLPKWQWAPKAVSFVCINAYFAR
jgi:hypothetical protein